MQASFSSILLSADCCIVSTLLVKQPVEIDILNNLVTGAAMLGAVALVPF